VCVAVCVKQHVDLYFAHDSTLLPLVALMDLLDLGEQVRGLTRVKTHTQLHSPTNHAKAYTPTVTHPAIHPTAVLPPSSPPLFHTCLPATGERQRRGVCVPVL
jgi:hypothetical protein